MQDSAGGGEADTHVAFSSWTKPFCRTRQQSYSCPIAQKPKITFLIFRERMYIGKNDISPLGDMG